MGVRSTDKAQAYLDTAMAYGLLPKGAERRVQIVEYDVTQPDTIAAAIGSASKVHAVLRVTSTRQREQHCRWPVVLQQQRLQMHACAAPASSCHEGVLAKCPCHVQVVSAIGAAEALNFSAPKPD